VRRIFGAQGGNRTRDQTSTWQRYRFVD